MLFSERRTRSAVLKTVAEWNRQLASTPNSFLIDLTGRKRCVLDVIADENTDFILVPYFNTQHDGAKRPNDTAFFVAVGTNPQTFWMCWNRYLTEIDADPDINREIVQDLKNDLDGFKTRLENRFSVKLRNEGQDS